MDSALNLFQSEDLLSFMADALPSKVNSDGSVEFVLEEVLKCTETSGEQCLSDSPEPESPSIVQVGRALLAPLSDETALRFKNAMRTRTGQNTQLRGWDKTGAVLLITNTLWENGHMGPKGEMMRLLGVKGTMEAPGSGTNVGSGITMISNRVDYGAGGASTDPSIVNVNRSYELGSQRSYFIAYTSPWVYTVYGILGQWWRLKLQRGDSEWDFNLENNIPYGY